MAVGGATSIGRFLGPRSGAGHRVLGLSDEAEAPAVLRALDRAGIGSGSLENRGFCVCRSDLEDELVRALGTGAVLDVVAGQGELASFRLLQRQPALRDRPLTAQLRRFFAGRSGHKITYARLLTAALPPDRTPPPLVRLLASL